jgi:hypothetical protein
MLEIFTQSNALFKCKNPHTRYAHTGNKQVLVSLEPSPILLRVLPSWAVNLLFGEVFSPVATAPSLPYDKKKIRGIPSFQVQPLEVYWLRGQDQKPWPVLQLLEVLFWL